MRVAAPCRVSHHDRIYDVRGPFPCEFEQNVLSTLTVNVLRQTVARKSAAYNDSSYGRNGCTIDVKFLAGEAMRIPRQKFEGKRKA
jgi:hypothetical protein